MTETKTDEIINTITFEQGLALAKAIDECALKAFQIPQWILRHRWATVIYSDLKRLEIRTLGQQVEFWKGGKLKAKMQIVGNNVMFY